MSFEVCSGISRKQFIGGLGAAFGGLILPADELKASRRLVWSDEFDGADLDPKKWRFRATMNSNDCQYANDARTCEVKDGKLCLHVRPATEPGKRCLLARGVATHETMGFRYGYLEMCAKVPFRHGAWPSFWMQATPKLKKCPWMSEIDWIRLYQKDGETCVVW